MKKSYGKSMIVVLIVILMATPFIVAGGYSLSTMSGRPTNYQGVNFTIYGADVGQATWWDDTWTGGDYRTTNLHYFYKNNSYHTYYDAKGEFCATSVSHFGGTEFDLDVDSQDSKAPNLRGSVDQIYPNPDFEDSYGKGHFKTYSWDYSLGNGENLHYEMDEWIWEINMNIVASPSVDLEKDGRYSATDIWLKAEQFMPQYFEVEGVEFERAYIAIAKIEIERVSQGLGAFTQDQLTRWGIGEANSPTSLIQVNLNEGLELMMYDSAPDAALTNPSGDRTAAIKAYWYNGARLNPDVFKDVVYIPIHLGSFGTKTEGYLWGNEWLVDAVTFKARVHLFTVGEWKVKNELHVDWGALVGVYGEKSAWDNFWSGIGNFFGSWQGILIILIVGFIVIIIVYAFSKAVFGRIGGAKTTIVQQPGPVPSYAPRPIRRRAKGRKRK